MVKYKYILAIDTNILVNLFTPDTYESWIFENLVQSAHFGLVNILVPKVALDEWNLIKEKRYQGFLEDQVKPLQKALKSSVYFRKADERSKYEALLHKAIKIRKREFKYTYGRKYRKIEEMIKNREVTISNDISWISKSSIADMALKKMAPFYDTTNPAKQGQSDKNETDDAFIFFAAYDYIKQSKSFGNHEHAIFLTANTEDYSAHPNKSDIHGNLAPYLAEANIEYSINIKDVVSRISLPCTPKVNKDEMEEIFQALEDYNFIDCQNPSCNEELHVNIDSYWGNYELRQYLCPTCKHTWSTDESIHDQIY